MLIHHKFKNSKFKSKRFSIGQKNVFVLQKKNLLTTQNHGCRFRNLELVKQCGEWNNDFELHTLKLLLYVPDIWQFWQYIASYDCRTGISTSTYNRNFRVLVQGPRRLSVQSKLALRDRNVEF
jgi:hypothetical protein